MGTLLKFSLLFAALAAAPKFASAQMVSQPGVTYNGKQTLQDLCTRNYPVNDSCASYLQQFSDGVRSFAEKALFTQKCQPLYQNITAISTDITAIKTNCDDTNAKVATFLGGQNTGGGKDAMAAAQDLSQKIGTTLSDCSTKLMTDRMKLVRLQGQIEDRIKSVESVSDMFLAHMQGARSECSTENSMNGAFDMTDLDARYKLGFDKMVQDLETKAGLAAGDYDRAGARLGQMVKGNSANATGLDSLRALVNQPK